MKKFILILITLVVIRLSATSQSSGDYRSIANGSWNDAAKWERYNGSNWISATSYPGENSGTGAVSIINGTEIMITSGVPHPITSLYVDVDIEGNLPAGILAFSSVNTVSLTVSGSVTIHGTLRIEDQNGTKAHTLFVGGGFEVGTKIYGDCFSYEFIPATFQSIKQDDKLTVVFTGYGWIDSGPGGIGFQDITFNGAGFTVVTPVYIAGTATFIDGIVTPLTEPSIHNADCQISYTYNGSIFFYDGATVSGASNASFVDGPVWKGGDDPFTFPIGNGNVYGPLTISAPSDQGASVSARYLRTNASDLGPISDQGLFNVSNCEEWYLDGPNNYPLDVTVGWNSASGCNSSPYVTNVSEVTLAHFNYATWRWDSHSGSGIGTTINGSVTWNNVTTSGLFSLGNLSSVCNAPWGNATNISSNSATLSWGAVGSAVSYDVDYKPYTSDEWINAATATNATSVNLSGLSSWLSYDWRIRTNCSLSSSSYRQAQFQTLCGAPLGLSTTNITISSATFNWSAFSNFVNYTVEYKQLTSETWITAATGINSLSYTLTGLTAGTAYDWRVLAICNVSYPGNYTQSSFTTPACIDIYELNNTSAQATPLVLGTTISANISSAIDVDWFKITIPGSSNIVLSVFLSSPPADYDLYVYNKSLTLVGSSITGGNETVTFNVHGKNNIYYIKVVGKNGAYNSSQCYNLVAYIFSSNNRTVSNTSDPANEVTGSSNKMVLYPNPASEFVYLNFNSATEGSVNIQILNSIGQLVKQHPVNTIKRL